MSSTTPEFLHEFSKNQISFFLNGKLITIKDPDPEMLLLEYIRDVALLTGTKLTCGEGGCVTLFFLIIYLGCMYGVYRKMGPSERKTNLSRYQCVSAPSLFCRSLSRYHC